MKYMRVGAPGAEIPVARTKDGRHLDLRDITADIDGRFLSSDGPARAEEAVTAGRLPELDVTGLRVGPPIARPSVVLCIGMNYAAHAAESGAAPPPHPVMFYKAPNTVVGPDDDVLLPRGSAKTDWEVELAVVIERMIFDVATLVHELSQVTVLEPGDLINTGTPEGVALSRRFPYLAEGDVMEMEIDGLGRQRQKVGQA
jgi:2-keto-4-pentenoate hydratase/2-oxohepta-3-ene-1,7-dioic acid hydratase in catechol pathway